MHALKSLVFLALIVPGLTGARAEDGAAQHADKAVAPVPAPASATVGPQLGQFYFPIPNIGGQWEWQAVASHQLEYKWAVTLPLQGETYEFGFSRFCFKPKSKSVGTFEELLESGQVDVWRKTADGGASLEQGMTGVTASRQGDGLLIRLTEPKLLAALLAEKPATLRFQSVSARSPEHNEDVRVTYQ